MTGTSERQPWQDAVLNDALTMANRVVGDFRLAIDRALLHTPSPQDPKTRHLILDEFFHVLPDVLARLVCDFGSNTIENERAVQEIIHRRFVAHRNENDKKIVALKNNGIILPPGVQ